MRPDGTSILNSLTNRDALRRARLMVIVAHPDDEVIGAGARLPDFTSASFVHVTTGAKAHSGPDYAARRGSELVAALKIAGLSSRQLRPLGWSDQALSRSLADLTKRIASVIAADTPGAVLTHPYEGGHPDHDAVAFAVHAACRAMQNAPPIIEMAFYHQGPQGIRTGEFLADHDSAHVTLPLSPGERELKRRLLNCFVSQAETLGYFSIDVERFRVAPRYDFTQPPHDGRLFYENFNWGVRFGAEWRALAGAALSQLQAT